jgi:hypothetical protein
MLLLRHVNNGIGFAFVCLYAIEDMLFAKQGTVQT